MATPVIMPRQGQSVESCIISEWFVKKGDKVKEGDLLFSYETDKAAFEEEAKASGTVLELFFKQGDDVSVLTNVCVIGEEGEDYSELLPGGSFIKQEGKKEIVENQPEVAAANAIEPEMPVTSGERFISPRARNLAEKTGADIRYATPTGPNGRIIERDVRNLQQQGILVTTGAMEAYKNLDHPLAGTGLGGRVTINDVSHPSAFSNNTADERSAAILNKAKDKPVAITEIAAEKPAARAESGTEKPGDVPYEDVKVSNIRKVIARSMHESLSQMAQLTLNASFDATEILNLRQQFKKNGEKMGLSNITLNDIVIYAVSRVLTSHKAINAHFLGDTMRYFTNVNMGVAIDTERGLMVPTIFNANLKSLNEISMEAKELAHACQKGMINPDKLKDGTFTVTNLGALGIESFTPVINPPQTAILGVNTLEQKFRDRNGTIEAYTAMSLSLTFDHRAVDGAPAARFLKDLREALESFTVLLAK